MMVHRCSSEREATALLAKVADWLGVQETSDPVHIRAASLIAATDAPGTMRPYVDKWLFSDRSGQCVSAKYEHGTRLLYVWRGENKK